MLLKNGIQINWIPLSYMCPSGVFALNAFENKRATEKTRLEHTQINAWLLQSGTILCIGLSPQILDKLESGVGKNPAGTHRFRSSVLF